MLAFGSSLFGCSDSTELKENARATKEALFRGARTGIPDLMAVDRCDHDSTREEHRNIELPLVHAPELIHAYVGHGDSGGPLLAGEGAVEPRDRPMAPPTPLTEDPSLPGRYVIGVASHADVYQTETPCTTDEDCDGGFCDPVSGKCGIPRASYASTYAEGNGLWLLSHIDDIDGDSKPNEADNCVGIYNPGQENCNLDAEKDRNGEELGDACDPVPCPAAEVPVRFEVVRSTEAFPPCVTRSTHRAVRDTIEPWLIGSHNLVTGIEMSQEDVTTRFRFCQIDAERLVDCSLISGQRQDRQLSASEPDTMWRRMTVAGELDPHYPWTYPGQRPPRTWDYWLDRARWIGGDAITDPGTLPKPIDIWDWDWTTSSRLAGALALVAGAERSADLLGTISRPENGVHWTPDRGDRYQTGEGLGRFYIDMAPDEVVRKVVSNCYGGLPCAGAGCPTVPPLSRFRWCLACSRPLDWWDLASRPIDALAAQTVAGEWGLVNPDGDIVLVDETVLSPVLQTKLSDPELRFVAAVEPYAEAKDGMRGAQAVFMRRDGTGIDDVVVGRETGFLAGSELAEGSTAAVHTITFGDMPPRERFGAVFSRSLQGVVVVGGELVATGELARDIWMLPLDGSAVGIEVPGYRPKRVLAATISPADNMLWVLDERRIHGVLRKRRLVRINILDGQREVVWQGPAVGLFDRHWLAADQDGQVLLFGTSGRVRKHFTVRFEATPFVLGTAKPVLIRFDKHDLVGEPLVDSSGYQFVVQKGRKCVKSYRIESLEENAWRTVDLSRCM